MCLCTGRGLRAVAWQRKDAERKDGLFLSMDECADANAARARAAIERGHAMLVAGASTTGNSTGSAEGKTR